MLDRKLIRDYESLSMIVNDNQHIGIEEHGSLQQLTSPEAIKTKFKQDDIRFFISCDIHNEDSVDRILKVKCRPGQVCYLELIISLDKPLSKDMLNQVFKWSTEANVPLLSLQINVNSDSQIDSQKVAFDLFVSCLEELIDPKLNIIFKLLGNSLTSLPMARWRLECVRYLFEHGFSVTRLDFQADSTAADGELTDVWEEIIKQVKELKVSYSAHLRFRHLKGEILDTSLFNEFLSAFPDERSQLVVPNEGHGEFTDRIQTMEVNIVDTVERSSIYFPHSQRLIIDLEVTDITQQVVKFARTKDLLSLYINAYSDNNFRSFTDKENEEVQAALRNIFSEFLILHHVLINETELKNAAPAYKELHKEFLKGRGATFLAHLVGQRTSARYSRAKVIFIGNVGSGKTATVNALLDKSFQEELPPSLVNATGATVFPWRNLPNTYNGISQFSSHMNYVLSAGDSMKVGIWEYGGKLKPLHPFFLKDYGIYCIVFDVSRCFSSSSMEETRKKMKKWAALCSFYGPTGTSICFIGTRAQGSRIDEDYIQDVNSELGAVLEDFYAENIIYNEQDDLWFFPVDNSKGLKNQASLAAIRNGITSALRNEENEAPWNKQIDLSWMFFMQSVYSSRKNLVSFNSIEQQAIEVGFSSQDCRQMVNFFAHAGAILDFSDIVADDAKPSIVLNTGWLFQALAALIQSRDSSQLARMKRRRNDGSRRLIPLLQKHSILSSTVMFNVLKNHNTNEISMELLTTICEQNLILSPLQVLPTNCKVPLELRQRNKFWMVPALYPTDQRTYSTRDMVTTKDIAWSEKVPRDLFASFISQVVKEGVKYDPFTVQEIKRNSMVAFFTGNKFEILYESNEKYILNIISEDGQVIEAISTLVGDAYGAVIESMSGRSVAEECAFFQVKHIVTVLSKRFTKI